MRNAVRITAPVRVAEPVLEIGLLGPPTIAWADRPISLTRRQSRALLYRIAASPHPVPREQLAFLLWPDLPEAMARRNLTVLLTQLRRALPSAAMLTTHGDSVALDPQLVRVDTAAFSAALQAASPGERLSALASAQHLYRGPFLQGFSPPTAEFDAWADEERRAWERRYLDALSALAEGYADSGDYPAAIEAAQRYLAVDELAEEMHRRLIELYAASGDRTSALRQFERCAAALQRELGVEPLPETRAAYEAVRDGHMPPGAARPVAARTAPVPPVVRTAPQFSLPTPAGPMIGRERELATAVALLRSPTTRLLTLTGPGGSGKTRLAQAAAAEVRGDFADGALFVALAPLHNAEQVIDLIAQACGIPASPGQPLAASLGAQLRDKQLLIVLDNLEHLPGAGMAVAELLAAAPGLRVLATSRSVLNIQGEHIVPVLPLPAPDPQRLPPLPALAEIPAVQLLVTRVQAINPRFQLNEGNAAAVAEICARLDGLPLALELAAARLKLLAPHELLQRFDQLLTSLTSGPQDLPARHRTLRATIEWSYHLLNDNEQVCFELLSVFAGGWTLEAADALGDGEPGSKHRRCPHGAARSILDTLTSLADKSLIQLDAAEDGTTRFRMLETLREYAQERLQLRASQAVARRRHALYYCRFTEQRAPGFHLPDTSAVEQDYHNVRAALRWWVDSGDAEMAMRMVVALFWFWDARGLIEEGWFWHTQVLGLERGPERLGGRVRAQAGYLALRRGRPDDAAQLISTVLAGESTTEARELALRVAGLIALQAGDLRHARARFEDAVQFAQQHSLSHDGAAAQFNLGILALLEGELGDAGAKFWASYAYWAVQQHPRFSGIALVALGFIAVLRDDPEQAAALLSDGLDLLVLVRETNYLLYGLLAGSALASIRGQFLPAVELLSAAQHHTRHMGLRLVPDLLARVHAVIERNRTQVPPDAFEAAAQRGRSLSLEATVALARSLIGAPAAHEVGRE